MENNKKKKIRFPKGFFQKVRPTVSNEETFNDVEQINWKKENIKSKKDVIVFPAKKKKLINSETN